MRYLALIAHCAALAACAATKEQVTAALGNKYQGQSLDRLVMEYGPPSASFKMADGSSSYQWELANYTKLKVGSQVTACNIWGRNRTRSTHS